MIRSNLRHLLEQRDMSIRELAEKIGYRFESVRLLYNDDMERYPRDLLTKLCAFFECSIGDILVFDDPDVDVPEK